jgi:hypothetical protein
MHIDAVDIHENLCVNRSVSSSLMAQLGKKINTDSKVTAYCESYERNSTQIFLRDQFHAKN